MKQKTMILGAVASACILAASMPVFAAESVKDSADTARSPAKHLEALVENGTLSQSTLEAIEAYLKENLPARTDRPERSNAGERVGNPFSRFVEEGVITQKTADAIGAYLGTIVRPEKGTKRIDLLETLQTAGVITQSERDALSAAFEKVAKDQPERQQGEHIDLFAQMVERGIITQSEYDAIEAARPEKPERLGRQAKA